MEVVSLLVIMGLSNTNYLVMDTPAALLSDRIYIHKCIR